MTHLASEGSRYASSTSGRAARASTERDGACTPASLQAYLVERANTGELRGPDRRERRRRRSATRRASRCSRAIPSASIVERPDPRFRCSTACSACLAWTRSRHERFLDERLEWTPDRLDQRCRRDGDAVSVKIFRRLARDRGRLDDRPLRSRGLRAAARRRVRHRRRRTGRSTVGTCRCRSTTAPWPPACYFTNCFLDPAGSNANIRREARKYAGDPSSRRRSRGTGHPTTSRSTIPNASCSI